jgi:hypothetical protein
MSARPNAEVCDQSLGNGSALTEVGVLENLIFQ